jgi:leucine dehydrogenase
VVPAEQIHQVDVRCLLPLRAGRGVRPETIGRCACRVIAGAANNQLSDAAIGDELQQRGVVVRAGLRDQRPAG